MKILLIVENDITKETLEIHLRPRGFEFITYRNPIKAMDNIEEIDPDIVLFSAEDFPRHWKPFLKLLREIKTKEETVFILLIGEIFPIEEAAKATHLGVNGIIGEDFKDKRKMLHIEGLLSRYKMLKDNRAEKRYIPDPYDEIEFLLSHPRNLKLITGEVSDISTSGARFLPDSPHLTTDLQPGAEVPYCSLRVGDKIISLTCTVVRNNQLLALKFIDISDDNKQIIQDYIDSRPGRELKQLKEKGEDRRRRE